VYVICGCTRKIENDTRFSAGYRETFLKILPDQDLYNMARFLTQYRIQIRGVDGKFGYGRIELNLLNVYTQKFCFIAV
jgi:hypothetical protein